MIYFRNYRMSINYFVKPGTVVRDKNDQIIRGVTPITATCFIHNPLDMATYVSKAANGLTRDEARRKAVFKARRAFMQAVKNKKPSLAFTSDNQYRVSILVDGAHVKGYGDTPIDAFKAAQNFMDMHEMLDDIVEYNPPRPINPKTGKFIKRWWQFWK
ncbi:hypothetical protein D3C85_771000 [compost metagenome]